LGTALTGEPKITKPDPDTLDISLPGVKVDPSSIVPPITNAIVGITASTSSVGSMLAIKLARPMGAQITNNGSVVSVGLIKPFVGNGRLAGKIIVVDPGHGGYDSGAHAAGVLEKNLTLPLGIKLGTKLAEAGATVIMTRKTDVFIPLLTRSQIANQSHADFFISCHINSTSRTPPPSGTITFFHMDNQVTKLLGECIQHEIAKVNHLPNLGVWSDRRIYDTGYSVLRHTQCPCVLIEMGFIDNSTDRNRVGSEEFQEAVTTAIVKGVKVFLGDVKTDE
jgi:N-acetylmuramoyl-L-alanine amidase